MISPKKAAGNAAELALHCNKLVVYSTAANLLLSYCAIVLQVPLLPLLQPQLLVILHLQLQLLQQLVTTV